jgi:cyclomaltodextrinase / maltogenic alpha-amylase / neopullulanase
MRQASTRAVAALLMSVLLIVACTGSTEGESSEGEGLANPRVVLDSGGGDSFSWTEKVTGVTDCEDLGIEVNGERVDAPVEINGTSFAAKVPVETGANEVVAVCGSGEDAARAGPVTFMNRLEQRPTARISLAVRKNIVSLDGGKSSSSQSGPAEIIEYSWTPGPLTDGLREQSMLRTVAGKIFEAATGPRLRLRAPSKDGEYFVTLSVTDEAGHTDTSTTYFEVEGGRARAVDLMHEHPSWIDGAVIYAPIPQLWGNRGPETVERRLSYLKSLGVDALWLWPPTSLRTSGEEYAVENYFEVDPSWGPEEALTEMVQAAHDLGMYVFIDFVPNHLSAEGPYFLDAEERGTLSSYWSFFDRKDGEATHYFDWAHLPNLNFDNPEVRRMVIAASVHWVRDIGVDGFRMDVAWGVKRRRPDFWPQLRKEVKRVNPDVLLLAEASATDSFYFSHGFDLAYDWTRELGQWAWEPIFRSPRRAGELLRRAASNAGRGYSKDALIMRFLNNNDTGARFIDQYGVAVTKIAATMQFTLPGVPAMFAGDEIGASYEPYSNLTRIKWTDKYGLRRYYKRLIELKHSVPALNTRQVELLKSLSSRAAAYIRPRTGNGPPVLVVLNFGRAARIELPRTPALDALLGSSGTMRNLVTGRDVQFCAAPGSLSVSMSAESSLVLAPKGGN